MNTIAAIEVNINPDALPETVQKGRRKVDRNRIKALGDRLSSLVDRIKTQAFLPNGGKSPPVFGLVQLAGLCKLSTDSMARRLAKADELGLPSGTIVPSKTQKLAQENKSTEDESTSEDVEEAHTTDVKTQTSGRRQWTLAEARQWVKACSIPFIRPKGMPGAVITIANFKGGVGKTITSMTLAQGLSLMGYKVLAIDVDPQGSLTSLFGILPTEVIDEMTILPLMIPPKHRNGSINEEAKQSIESSIRETYWDGLDLVAGSRSLFGGEFYLPSRQIAQEPGFDFYEVLNRGITPEIREKYDYIIIDTMPSLSYLTMNTLWAADAVVMPLPAEGLDIVSSSQFWNMFTELASVIPNNKTFDFIGVLPSKVDNTKGHTKSLLKWIEAGFGEFLLSVEIPATQVVSLSSTELRTVFDITKYVGAAKTYARARDAYDEFVLEIDNLTRRTCWSE